MRSAIVGVLAFVAFGASVSAHDMFLTMPEHQVPAHQEVDVTLVNGTFEKSENTIDRDRMGDVSVITATGEAHHPKSSQWRDEGKESILTFASGQPGTIVLGVSTKSKIIELTGEEFDEYLLHDGVLDIYEERQRTGSQDQPVRERYSKHVKAVLQAGDEGSESWKALLGYPVEIVPLSDPLALKAGDTLEIQVLLKGEPVADQLVYASHEGYHGHGDDGIHQEAVKTRTDENGVARISLDKAGRWYARLIHMVPSGKDEDYISNWATLTFQVR